jgi:hypothetical protein
LKVDFVVQTLKKIANIKSLVSREYSQSLPDASQDLVNYPYKKVFFVGAAGE